MTNYPAHTLVSSALSYSVALRTQGRLVLAALVALLMVLPLGLTAQDAVAGGASIDPAVYSVGEKVYKGNCASCHKIDGPMTGPALGPAYDQWSGNMEELTHMIQVGAAKYATEGRTFSARIQELYGQYGQWMPQQYVSDDEAKAVILYAKARLAELQADKPDAALAGGGGGAEFDDKAILLGLVLLGLVLVVFVLLLIVMVAVVVNAKRAKANEQPFDWKELALSLAKNKFVVTLVGLAVVLGGLNATVEFAQGIGLHKGYQPVQPIRFSHKLHAGQYKIACQYCHVGVERGKSATIPSTNICMNCHKAIQKGPQYGEAEIGKIYAHWESGKSIEWVRIHNLPDLVYFNHAQHVAVGGLECQTCHGPIEEMEEVYQYNDLSMGWCINCHRETEVDVTKNNYYLAHQGQYKAEGRQTATVAELGGLHCARCHY
jgi:mono/diheme cytochrome c family protein